MTTKLMINGKEIPANLAGPIIFALTGADGWKYSDKNETGVLTKIQQKVGDKAAVSVEVDGVTYVTTAEYLEFLFRARIERRELGQSIKDAVRVSGKPEGKRKSSASGDEEDLLALLD